MKYILFIVLVLISSCSFQPNDSNGIILQKVSKDSVTISIIDSYHIIKEYKTREEKDTLFIEIKSIYTPAPEDSTVRPIFISLKSSIQYIKLQNDKIFDINSIPMSAYSNKD